MRSAPGSAHWRALLTAALAASAACAGWPGHRPPPGVVAVTVRGHHEVIVGEDGTLVPRFLGSGRPLGLCLATAPETDTSQWQGRLYLRGDRPGPEAPWSEAVRMETTLCFRLPAPANSPGETELCGELRDTFDGRRFDLPCRPVRLDPEDAHRQALLATLGELLAQTAGIGTARRVAELDRLAARARARGLPLLAVRLELIASYYLRRDGSPQALARARSRLAHPPAWLALPEAGEWAAQVAQERALLEMAAGWRLRTAWKLLGQADEAYLRLAHPKRFTVAMQRADLLARVGAVGEAVGRLRRALDDCGRWPCDPHLVPAAQGTLAWLIGQDPLAGAAELAEAQAVARQALAGIDPAADPLEHANQRINLAYLELRAGGEPEEELAAARALLEGVPAGARRRQLLGWATWIEARARLGAGRPGEALELCLGLTRGAGDPRLAAGALACAGRARRLLGDLAGAAEAFDQALVLYEHGSPVRLGQNIALEPGQRADAFYQAARVAVERGEAGQAWDLLARLDRLVLDEEELRRCRESAGAEAEARAAAVESRRRELLEQLAALELPAAGARRAQREPIRRSLQTRLQELAREAAGCPPPAASPGPAELTPGYRAMALDDEILLLRRHRDGRVTLHRRSPFPRARLVALLARVRSGLDRRDLEDSAWRSLLAPLAPVFLPAEDAPGEPVRFALHGILQEVPLAALPLPPGGRGPGRWLGDLRTVVLRPAGGGQGGPRELEIGHPLFVVDPTANLASARGLAGLYRRLFPAGRVLVGEAATRVAVGQALAGARWVHFDTHGEFDPAFPELTRLALADGFIDLEGMASWQVEPELANLVGCNTGRWPATADSGRYGLAGLLCRRGARWVVATRAAVADEVAAGFNRAFYAGIARGESVPRAYGDALATLARTRPAVEWAAFLLLGGGGQTGGVVTP